MMSPGDEEAVILILASYAQYLSSPCGELNTREDEINFETAIVELQTEVSKLAPELSEKQLDDIYANLFDKVHGLGMTPPDVPAQYLKLVNKGYELYLQRELLLRKSLIDRDYLGQISTGLICYELINAYSSILNHSMMTLVSI